MSIVNIASVNDERAMNKRSCARWFTGTHLYDIIALLLLIIIIVSIAQIIDAKTPQALGTRCHTQTTRSFPPQMIVSNYSFCLISLQMEYLLITPLLNHFNALCCRQWLYGIILYYLRVWKEKKAIDANYVIISSHWCVASIYT